MSVAASRTPTRFLHVANGSSVTTTLEAAGVPGARSIWADPLHLGPVPAGLTDAELLEVRAGYLGAADAPEHDMRLWRAPLERQDSWDELILWFEHDLFDQLNLIQLLTWIRGHVPATKAVSLICIGSFSGRTDFKGLGELDAGELAPLLDTRTPVTESQYALATRAWQAFREPIPDALNELCAGESPALPYLVPAMKRFLQEYPWTRDGLSRSERRLLALAEGGGIALSKAFQRMHDEEHAYYVTDLSLIEMVSDLSRSTPPLLTLDRPDARAGVLQGTVALTDAGRSVLAGRLDRVAACGLERWFGGVHLQSSGSLWRWDEAQQRIIAG